MGKATEKLSSQLDDTKSITEFLHENKAAFINKPIGDYIKSEIQKREFSKAKAIRDSGINKRYFLDILNGSKTPTRRYIIRIFLALGLELKDAQWYLNACAYPQLYSRNRADSIIIYCFNHKLSVRECNTMLNKAGLENLGFENT